MSRSQHCERTNNQNQENITGGIYNNNVALTITSKKSRTVEVSTSSHER